MLKRQKDSVLRGPARLSKPQFQWARTILLGLVLAAVALLPGGTPSLDEGGGAEFVLEKGINNFLLVDRLQEAPLEDALLGNEHWEMVYFDDLSAVFVNDSQENSKVIDGHAYSVVRPSGKPPFQEEGQEQEALKEYQRALAVNPDFVGGHADLAAVYEYLVEYDLAVEHTLIALKLVSEKSEFWGTTEGIASLYARLYTNLANIYVKTKNWDKAISFYNRVLELDPNHPLALNNLGLIYTSYQMDQEKSLAMLHRYAQYLAGTKDKKIREKVEELIADVRINGPRAKPPAPPSGMIRQGEFASYMRDPLAHLYFRFVPPSPFNTETHSSWNWGAVTDFTTSSTNKTRQEPICASNSSGTGQA